MVLLSWKEGIWMKDYSIVNRNLIEDFDRDNFITGVNLISEGRNDVFQVSYADGDTDKADYLEQNIQHIEQELQQQMQLGVSNLPKLVRARKTGIMQRVTGSVVAGLGSSVFAISDATGAFQLTDNPGVFATGLGVVAAGFILVSAKYILSTKSAINGIKRLKYRSQHESEVLEFMDAYPEQTSSLLRGGDSRLDKLDEYAEDGIMPTSLLADELRIGLSDSEFNSILHASAKKKKRALSYTRPQNNRSRNKNQ